MSQNLKMMAEQVWMRATGKNFTDKSRLNWREVASFILDAKGVCLYRLSKYGAVDRNYGQKSEPIPSDSYDIVRVDTAYVPDSYYQAVLPADFSDLPEGMTVWKPGPGGQEAFIVTDMMRIAFMSRLVHSQGAIYCWRKGGVIEFASDPGPAVDIVYLAQPSPNDIDDETVIKMPDYLHQHVMDMVLERIAPGTQREDDKRADGNDNQKP